MEKVVFSALEDPCSRLTPPLPDFRFSIFVVFLCFSPCIGVSLLLWYLKKEFDKLEPIFKKEFYITCLYSKGKNFIVLHGPSHNGIQTTLYNAID